MTPSVDISENWDVYEVYIYISKLPNSESANSAESIFTP